MGYNTSTKGDWHLASHGLRVKDLLAGFSGGLDRHPVATGEEPGIMQNIALDKCSCDETGAHNMPAPVISLSVAGRR
tara:strand:- start:4999 stop:5229 length:231 start_codon:yes stop_codon:yes gene_type:complete